MLNSILPVSTANPLHPKQAKEKAQPSKPSPIRFGNGSGNGDSVSISMQRDNSENPQYLLVNLQSLAKATSGKKVDFSNVPRIPVKNLPQSATEALTDHSEGNKDWEAGQKTWGALHGIKDRIFNWDNIKTDVGIACLITVATCWLPGSQLIFIPTYLAISNSMHAVRGAIDGWRNPGKYLKNEKPGKLASQNNETGLTSGLSSNANATTEPEKKEASPTKDAQPQQQNDGQKKDGNTPAPANA